MWRCQYQFALAQPCRHSSVTFVQNRWAPPASVSSQSSRRRAQSSISAAELQQQRRHFALWPWRPNIFSHCEALGMKVSTRSPVKDITLRNMFPARAISHARRVAQSAWKKKMLRIASSCHCCDAEYFFFPPQHKLCLWWKRLVDDSLQAGKFSQGANGSFEMNDGFLRERKKKEEEKKKPLSQWASVFFTSMPLWWAF